MFSWFVQFTPNPSCSIMFDQLMKVSRGFKLVFIGMLLVFLALIINFLFTLVSGMAGGGGGLQSAIASLTLLLSLAGNITGLIGRIFCLFTPERAGSAKQLMIISIVLEVTSMALGGILGIAITAKLEINSTLLTVLPLALAVCTFTSGICFLLFTRAMAEFVRSRDLADSAMSVLKLFLTATGCYIVGIVLYVGLLVAGVGAGAAAGGAVIGVCLGGLTMLAGLIFAVIGLIRFIALMKEMSEAVARYARIHRRKQREKRESERKRREAEDEDEDEEEEEEEEEDDEEEDDDEPPRRRGKVRR
jgi:MFS family permease